eukprot:SM000018S03676  [mRNA]  locus=s18:688682:690496:- [translate_table: standard]
MPQLSDDVLLLIMAKVAAGASAPANLINAMLTCRRMCVLGTHRDVLRGLAPVGMMLGAAAWSDGAYRFLRRCSRAGNMDACYTLGMIKFYCLEDRRGGAALMAQAAMAGHAGALYSLAIIHFNGSGGRRGDRDLASGVILCAKAAAAGHVDALRELGHCLEDGYGLPANVVEGRRLQLEANAREAAQIMASSIVVPCLRHGAAPPPPPPLPVTMVAPPPVAAPAAAMAAELGPVMYLSTAPLPCFLSTAVAPASSNLSPTSSKPSGSAPPVEAPPQPAIAKLPAQVAAATVAMAASAAGEARRLPPPPPPPPSPPPQQPQAALPLAPTGAAAAAFVLQLGHLKPEPSSPPSPPPLAALQLTRRNVHSFLVGWHRQHAAAASSAALPAVAAAAAMDGQQRPCSSGRCGRCETRCNEYRCCSACGGAKYCSRACQAADWRAGHKLVCPLVAALGP